MRLAYALLTGSADETRRAGELLARFLLPGDVLSLEGDLGAGKTCLAQGIARGLGVPHAVTSPTFNILLVHPGSIPFYHFDLYRLERAEELEDIGLYDMIDSDGICAVEWGDRFPGALPADHLSVAIHRAEDGLRRLDVVAHGERSAAVAAAWHEACSAEGMGL